MGLLDKLFGKNEIQTKEQPVANPADGAQYFGALDLKQYGFTEDEQNSICAFYNYSLNKDNDIYPIDKEEFDQIQWLRDTLPNVCFLWADGQSNYAGVYFQGPYRGMVMILAHDNPMYAPLYVSISSFVDTVQSTEMEDLDIPHLLASDMPPTDFPSKTMNAEQDSKNLDITQQLLAQIPSEADEEKQVQMAYGAMYLCPAQYLDLLFPLFDIENMYIQQDICDIFVFHQYIDAIPRIEQAANGGSVHIKNSAKRALEMLKSF